MMIRGPEWGARRIEEPQKGRWHGMAWHWERSREMKYACVTLFKDARCNSEKGVPCEHKP